MVQPNYRHWPQNRLPSWTWGQAVPAVPLLLSLCTACLFGEGPARAGSFAVHLGSPYVLRSPSMYGCAGSVGTVTPLRSSLLRLKVMSFYQFSNEYGETYGSCEVFHWDRFDCQDAGLIERDPESPTGWVSFEFGMGGTLRVEADPTAWEGWYWQACSPGCLPDGDPMGPFETEADAIADANCI